MIAVPGPMSDDHALAACLRRSVADALAAVVGDADTIALLDFPYHRNAGDAAIWRGTRAVLRDLGVRVGYEADAGRYSPMRLQEAVPTGPVLLQGGGNLGDLWPWSQGLRSQVLADLKGRTVVQLPQSMHFQDVSNEERFAAVVEAHGDYVLMTRDQESFDASSRLAPARRILAPDMAFGLGHLPRSAPPSVGVLVLARDDVEEASGLRVATARAGLTIVDWDLGRVGDLAWQVRRLVPRLARFAMPSRAAWRATAAPVSASFAAMSTQVLDAGLALLSSAHVVVTDRLHAHILCTLLGVPHVVLDNSYGKISALHRLWTETSRTTHWASDADEALVMALDMVSATR